MSSGIEHGHEHHSGPTGFASVPWSVAVSATLHCLTKCAIGEVLGMVIGTAAGLSNTATVVLAVALAFVFGYALTMRGVLRDRVGVADALKVALAADTVSIAVMEIVDNAIVLKRSGGDGSRPGELAVLGNTGLRVGRGVRRHRSRQPVDDQGDASPYHH